MYFSISFSTVISFYIQLGGFLPLTLLIMKLTPKSNTLFYDQLGSGTTGACFAATTYARTVSQIAVFSRAYINVDQFYLAFYSEV